MKFLNYDARISRTLLRAGVQAVLSTAACFLFSAVSVTPAQAANPPIVYVSGYGNYCSITWPDGGSVFGYYYSGGDPCNSIDAEHSGTIRKKGLFRSEGYNDVVLRCDQGVWFWTGWSTAPLQEAYHEAYNTTPKSNCVFTVAPREMPVLRSPIQNLNIPAGSGFDFALPPYDTLDLKPYGGVNPAATIVDNKAHDKSGGPFVKDHKGYDWGVPKGTQVFSPADGLVVLAHSAHKLYPTDTPPCDELITEIFVQHKFCGPYGYCEEFATYYSHLAGVFVQAGQFVKAGQLLGLSGQSGCVSPHLHFSVGRLTNTADHLNESLVFTNSGIDKQGYPINELSNLYNFAIDPYGWKPLNGPDPWGWMVYGKGLGAMSINLWDPHYTPSQGSW